MNKDRFIFLLNSYTSLTNEETMELVETQKEFPFSQVIYPLVAMGAITNQLEVKDKKLQTAAVYIADRAVLKSIVTAPRVDRVIPPRTVPQVQETPRIPQEAEKVKLSEVSHAAESKTESKLEHTIKSEKSLNPDHSLTGDRLLEEVYKDLDKLKHLKHDFEAMMMGSSPEIKPKELTNQQDLVKVVEKPKKRKPENEGIISEIKSSKKKIKPSDPKQKEQLDLINQFIKSKPTFNKNSTLPADAPDLSEPSNVFSDNIVSETLVEILIKQGKKEKAIEVLKKLIWKFPQKKAYFAAQIEELKS